MKLLDKLYEENTLKENELLALINKLDEDETLRERLFELATEVRKKYYDNRVFMRGLIEFTNYCKRNCLYCGIRRENERVDRYRLSKEQILDCCKEGYRLGYRTFVLQGGEDPYFTDEKIVDLVASIKELYKDAAVTLSIGEKTKESYKKFYDAGADRYLLRHETACSSLYSKIHEQMTFEDRENCLYNLKEIGFQTGAGFMVGLPNQTNEILVKDLLFLKELNPEMIGIGPFIPHENTPLKNEHGGTVLKTRVMVALVRLLLPEVLLPSTTALGTLDKKGREKALKSGANVVMPNLSPTNVREKYELYKDKICTGDEAAHCRKCIEGRINSVGFEVDMSRGDNIGWNRK